MLFRVRPRRGIRIRPEHDLRARSLSPAGGDKVLNVFPFGNFFMERAGHDSPVDGFEFAAQVPSVQPNSAAIARRRR
jgi:hypothetical protein